MLTPASPPLTCRRTVGLRISIPKGCSQCDRDRAAQTACASSPASRLHDLRQELAVGSASVFHQADGDDSRPSHIGRLCQGKKLGHTKCLEVCLERAWNTVSAGPCQAPGAGPGFILSSANREVGHSRPSRQLYPSTVKWVQSSRCFVALNTAAGTAGALSRQC